MISKRKLAHFIEPLVFLYTKKACMINYVFCNDEYLLEINQQYLNHDTYTDIITFDVSEKNDNVITSDIFISIERVAENANQLHVPFKEELHRVILHGALHLCGYADKTKLEKETMRKLENKYLKKYFAN